jgi:uncharacterized cupin superfamily protein
MSYRAVHAADVAAAPGPHPAASAYDKSLGELLGLQAFAVYQVELPPFARSTPHDHERDRVEDMYAVIAGSGRVSVDDDEVPVEPGAFVSVTPGATRYVEAGADGLVYIAVCSR